MEESAYIADAVACVVILIAGARLYGLSVRTGKAPERLLSVCFVLWGLSYPLYDLPYVLAAESLVAPFSFAARILLHTGTVTLALFTRSVFRSHESWARWLVAATAACLIAGLAGSVWVGDWEGDAPLSNPWYWPECVGRTAPMAWIAAEGLAQYGKARQRRRLGLCDALACNRFLLWGLSGTLWVTLELVFVAQNVLYERTQLWLGPLDLLTAFLEITPVGAIWLVFFPPLFYRRWIHGPAADANTPEAQ